MENKKVNATQVALYVTVGLGVIGIVGGFTYYARKLWFGKSNPVQDNKDSENQSNQEKEKETSND